MRNLNSPVRFRSILTVAAGILPLLAAPSFSAQFTLLTVDNGGGAGTLGAPVTPSAGAFYRAPQMVTPLGLPPSRETVAQFPLAEFSSYIAMGGAPTTLTEAANPPANFIYTQFKNAVSGESGGATELAGVRYNFPVTVVDPVANPYGSYGPSHSVPGPLGPDTVFLGRLTVQRGERPVGPSFIVGVTFNNLPGMRDGKTQPVVVRATLDGPAEIVAGAKPVKTPIPTTSLLVKSRLSAQITIPEWGEADVYDIYAVSESQPPKELTVTKSTKPKKVKTPKKPAKQIQSRSIVWTGERFPDDRNIQYGPTGAASGTRGAASTAAPAESSLVRQIMTSMGLQ